MVEIANAGTLRELTLRVRTLSIDILDITFLTVSVCSMLSSGRTSDNSALLVSTKFSFFPSLLL